MDKHIKVIYVSVSGSRADALKQLQDKINDYTEKPKTDFNTGWRFHSQNLVHLQTNIGIEIYGLLFFEESR